MQETPQLGTRLPIAGIPLAFASILGYLALVIAATLLLRRGDAGTGSDLSLVPVYVVLAALVLLVARLSAIRPWRSRSIGRIGALGAIPTGLVLIAAGIAATTESPVLSTIAVALALAILVGIAEETLFRGITLHAFGARWSVPAAVIATSIVFGLAHMTNAIWAESTGTIAQVGFTVLAGFVWGWVYIASRGNLVLTIILHAGWDFGLFVISAQPSEGAELAIGTAELLGFISMAALAIILTVWGVRRFRGRRLSDVLA